MDRPVVPRLCSRLSLSEIVSELLDEMPPDPTNLEDVVHSSLFLGKPNIALEDAARLDIWLAAHLADMMEPLELIDNTPDEWVFSLGLSTKHPSHIAFASSELTLREHYIIAYCEYLRSDPALWRITVDYLCTCGPIGLETADEVLLRVPLRLQPTVRSEEGAEEQARLRAGALAGVIKEVSASCYEHKREAVRRAVCRVAAQTVMREREFGLAVSYCVSAEDWVGLGRVVDRMLEVYIAHGTYALSLSDRMPA